MKDKVIDKFSVFITSAFGFVAALAWNGAVKAVFDKYYSSGEGIVPMFGYAIVVSLVAVVFILIVEHVGERVKKVDLLPKKIEIPKEIKRDFLKTFKERFNEKEKQ